MPNLYELLDGVSQIVTAKAAGSLYFRVIVLKKTCSQMKLSANTAKQCNFNIVGQLATETFRFLTGFFGLADIPTEFQKTMELFIKQMQNIRSVFWMIF